MGPGGREGRTCGSESLESDELSSSFLASLLEPERFLGALWRMDDQTGASWNMAGGAGAGGRGSGRVVVG